MKAMTPLSLGQLNFHIPVPPLVLFAILALLIVGWCIFTMVIRYHWKNYSVKKLDVFAMNFFYLIGSAILITLLAAFAFLYLGSAGG